jgi:hypothetical protein
VKRVSLDGDFFLLLVGEFYLGGVVRRVEVAAYGETGLGGGAGDEVDDGLVGREGTAGPVEGDLGEQAMKISATTSGCVPCSISVTASSFSSAVDRRPFFVILTHSTKGGFCPESYELLSNPLTHAPMPRYRRTPPDNNHQ